MCVCTIQGVIIIIVINILISDINVHCYRIITNNCKDKSIYMNYAMMSPLAIILVALS